MSFSGDIKDEIAHQLPDDYHCLLAETAAMIHYAGTVGGTAEDGYILLETENVVLAKKYLRLIKKAFDIGVDLYIQRLPSGKNHKYRILLSSETEAEPAAGARAGGGEDYTEDALSEIGVGDKFSRVFLETADWERPGFAECLLEYPCCRRAFIRGAFLTTGSMSNPGKSYHLEIVCRKMQGAEELCQVMETFGVSPKIIRRKNKYVVYLKDSGAIADILNVMNAPNALMKLENIRIIKDMKNSANRQYNCDSANISKVVRTAARQAEDIRYIKEHLGFDRQTPALREMAEVRLEHPEESLQGLGTYLDPPVGKSGVNHRLKKLGEIAAALRQEE